MQQARFNEAERRVLHSIADAIEQVGRRAGGIYNLTGNFGFAPGGPVEKRAFASLVRKKLIKRARSEGKFQYQLTTKGIHFLARPFIKRVGRHARHGNPRRVYAVRVYAYPRNSRNAFAARQVGAPPAAVIGWGRTAEEAMREAEASLNRPPRRRRNRRR